MQFDKLTVKVQQIIREAQSLAEQRNHQIISPIFLLLAMVKKTHGIIVPILRKLGVDPGILSERINEEMVLPIQLSSRITGLGVMWRGRKLPR